MDRRRGVTARALTRALFTASALLWLVIAGLIATRSFDVGPVSPEGVNRLAGVMFAAALLMGFLGWRVLKGSRLIDGIAVAVAVVNVVLTFTDDIGAYDIAYLVVSLALLASLTFALVSSRRLRVD